MTKSFANYEKESDLEMWWRVTKEVFGNKIKSKILGSKFDQNGYVYTPGVVAYLDDVEVARYTFELPPEDEEGVTKNDSA